jgi:hypothetical protein
MKHYQMKHQKRRLPKPEDTANTAMNPYSKKASKFGEKCGNLRDSTTPVGKSQMSRTKTKPQSCQQKLQN